MKISFVLLSIVILFFTGCKSESYYHKSESIVQITDASISDFPDGSLNINTFYKGLSPLSSYPSLEKDILLSCPEYNISLQSVAPIDRELNTFILLDNIKSKTIIDIRDKEEDYDIFVSDEFGFENFSSIDDYKPKDFLKKNISLLTNLEKYIYEDSLFDKEIFLIIYIGKNNKFSEDNITRLEDLISHIDTMPNLWFGIFYEGSAKRHDWIKEELLIKNCMFVKSLKRFKPENQNSFILKFQDIIKEKDYKIDFTLGSLVDPDISEIHLNVDVSFFKNTVSDEKKIKLNEQEIRRLYINSVLKKTNSLYEQDGILVATSFLESVYKQHNFSEFYDFGVDIFKKQLSSNSLEDTTRVYFDELFELFEYGKITWDINRFAWFDSTYFYQKLAFKDFLEKASYPLDERETLYYDILDFYENNESINKYVTFSNKVNAIKQQMFNEFFPLSQNSYDYLYKLYDLMKSNPKLINGFKFNFYYADVAERIKVYNTAVSQYTILLELWKKDYKNYITWDQLLNKLFYLYAKNLNFDKAYALLKQTSIQKDESRLPDLNLTVTFLRSRYLLPLLYSASKFLSNDYNTRSNYLTEEFKKIDMPIYLDAIYILSSNNNVKKMLFENPNSAIKIPKEKNISTEYYEKSNDICWLIKNNRFGKIVIQMSNALSNSEEVNLMQLRDDFSSPKRWREMEILLDDNHRSTIIAYITFFAQYEYLNSGISGVEKYKNSIELIPNFRYFGVQNKQFDVVYNINITSDLKKKSFWSKSSNAQLYYENEFNNRNEKIYDMTYPMFHNFEWQGVVRLGSMKN